MSYRTICATEDQGLRRLLRRSLCAAGSVAEFVGQGEDLAAIGRTHVDLVVLDGGTVSERDIRTVLSCVGGRGTVVLLGNPHDADALFDLLRLEGCDHLVGRDSREALDEEEFLITCIKALRGDIFGPEKYLAWGVPVRERLVATYDEKRTAIREVTDFARAAGLRRQQVARVEVATDELLMNALYDAPASRYGRRPSLKLRLGPGGGPVSADSALLRFGLDSRNFVVAVRDDFGALRKEHILDHLIRARDEKGMPRLGGGEDSGAGLGLHLVMSSTTRLVADVAPGRTTEVMGLFDLRTGAGDAQRARSLSFFVERPASAAVMVDAAPGGPTAAST